MTQPSEKRTYRWASGYEKTWDAIKEDQSGSLATDLERLVRDAHAKLRQKRRRSNAAGETGFLRLGMMRHLYLILDLSSAMMERDLKPNRLLCSIKWLAKFVEDYFDQNPTSQLGIIAMAGSKTERITELSGSPARHLVALEELSKRQCIGEPSIQNALTMAESRLRYMPAHSSREIILVVASLTTCDPGDIHQTIQSLITHRIRCSVISLAVEVFVHRAIAEATQSSLHVILDAAHLKATLQELVPPQTVSEESEATLIRIGFPHSKPSDFEQFPVKNCMCHLPSILNNNAPTVGSWSPLKATASYICPRCRAVYCELPVECTVCGITLVAAPHLARAYHHLFPLLTFTEVPRSENSSISDGGGPYCCAGCGVFLSSKPAAYKCTKCGNSFCADCDIFLHDSVHSCPTCAF
uniref:General transcription factor IIH subunit n=1 Tax=Mesocestoides corti TaxID=53468 RepID=A0A5K3ENM7_MESCO